MDVTFLAYSWRVPQPFGHRINGRHDVPFCLGFRVELLQLQQSHCGKHCSRPGAEILGGKIFSTDFSKIRIHVV
jgi:hypothetical protein